MFASTKNKECREFRDLRWEKARREKELSEVLFVVKVTRLHLFILFFRHSTLTREGSRKSAGKAGFSEASFLHDKRVISQNIPGAILLRKCFKDLANTQYVMDELGALYASYRTKCRRYAMRGEYDMFAFSLSWLSDIFIVLYISFISIDDSRR